MPYVARFAPNDVAPLLVMGCPRAEVECLKREMDLPEATYRRLKQEAASLSIRIEREPLPPRKPDGMDWKEWGKIRKAQLLSQPAPVEDFGEYTFEDLKKRGKSITIKENAEDDDDTAVQYIVLNEYFPKGQYTFHDRSNDLTITLPSYSPATQEEFEASYRKLLENPRVKEGWGEEDAGWG
eukprot:325280-Rhodomonas_salina.1